MVRSVAIGDHTWMTLLRLACFLLLLVAQDGLVAASIPADMSERLAACAACHGRLGEGMGSGEAYVPHLSGKPAGYLFAQLRAFRDGRRHYGPMVWLTRNLDDRALQQMAAFYAAQTPQTSAGNGEAQLNAAAVRRARALVFEGSSALPACAACHGEDLAGLEPGVPALVGLPVEYILSQLGAWRTGVRQAQAPDCMADVARAIEPSDLRPLAEWLAAQGHEQRRRPAPAGSFILPRDCGPQTSAAIR